MTAIKSYLMFAIALLALIAVCAAIPAHAQFSVMYNFGSKSGDPENPMGAVAQGRDGSLYSTSYDGGTNNSRGTVFKITPAGKLNVLHNFCSQANCADGGHPAGGLTLRPDGHFLGTTVFGNTVNGAGTIFDISQTGSLTTLYNFTGGPDGTAPNAAPVQGPDGSFYGTAAAGGVGNCGTIYKITNSGATTGGFKLLHGFDNTDGCQPTSSLVLGIDGNLYGTTYVGGSSNDGVVFKITPAGKFIVLYNFDGTAGTNPDGPLTQGADGNFYGTTSGNGTLGDFGEVFKITPSGTLTVVHSLNGTTDGKYMLAGVVQASDGNFYGAAEQGGTSVYGTLFQVAPGGFSVLYNFDNKTGSFVETTPFQHTNGRVYGDTSEGGTGTADSCSPSVCGVFYSWDTGLPAFVSTVPFMAPIGTFVEILGQGFTSTTTVSFNGTPATATVVSGTYLRTTVPAGATTGPVTVTTSGGTLTSNRQFVVMP